MLPISQSKLTGQDSWRGSELLRDSTSHENGSGSDFTDLLQGPKLHFAPRFAGIFAVLVLWTRSLSRL